MQKVNLKMFIASVLVVLGFVGNELLGMFFGENLWGKIGSIGCLCVAILGIGLLFSIIMKMLPKKEDTKEEEEK